MLIKKETISALVLTGALLASVPVLAHSANNQQNMPANIPGNIPDNMHGDMHGNMHGESQNMMHQGSGMGHGMMMGYGTSPCAESAVDKELSSLDVRTMIDGHLISSGHKHLKAGEISTQQDGSYIAEINTADGSLVWRMAVDPKTGRMHHLE